MTREEAINWLKLIPDRYLHGGCESSVERNGSTIFCNGNMYVYKATDLLPGGYKWRPSIHMPREAARIFLRVTDVRVERLQSITELDILEKEGVTVDFPQPKPSYASLAYAETRLKPAVRKAFADLWNACYSKPHPVKTKGVITHYESYSWEDIQETRTYRGKPWYVIGNPWVWIIEFERISREEAQHE